MAVELVLQRGEIALRLSDVHTKFTHVRLQEGSKEANEVEKMTRD